jgi:hypothetical protein
LSGEFVNVEVSLAKAEIFLLNRGSIYLVLHPVLRQQGEGIICNIVYEQPVSFLGFDLKKTEQKIMLLHTIFLFYLFAKASWQNGEAQFSKKLICQNNA